MTLPRIRVQPRGSRIAIDHALHDDNLLGAALGDPATWSRWLSVLRAAFALPMDKEDRATFAKVAGDRRPPTRRVNELWCICGRRSGKTRTAAALATYIGAIEKHTLARGEIGYVPIIAASRSQATVAFSYVVGFLEASPLLRQQITGVTASEVQLRGNIVIGVHANSFRTVRGRTLLAVVADESAFWRDETSAQPDVETFRACLPSLAATRGMWIGISSPYRKVGLLYQRHRDNFAQESDDVLVVQGPSTLFNPTLDQDMIAKARKDDPESALAEWDAEFRTDITTFLADDLIDNAIEYARPLELPPRKRVTYAAFSDASGGRHDAFTLCIGHREGDRIVADVIRGKHPPFDPQAVTAEYAKLAKDYGVNQVVGDAYGAAWVETAWRENGLRYVRSDMPKSQLYLEALPAFTRGIVSIPDHAKLIRELRLLERRTSRAGKDTVDHGRNGSDDHANALAGLIRCLATRFGSYDVTMRWACSDDDLQAGSWRSRQMFEHLQPTLLKGEQPC
jgi:hypothetical protein